MNESNTLADKVIAVFANKVLEYLDKHPAVMDELIKLFFDELIKQKKDK